MSAMIPIPRCEVSVRPAVAGDYAFMDRLAGMHSKALGFSSRAFLEGKIRLGEVLIAEDQTRLPIGYCISVNRYLKRDELGCIYQMNIAPGAQRKLVAATLLKEVFERAPYGCKLFCCWCRQDLDANYFWEAMGFVPLALRADAKGKLAHIFWQRRIRQGDTSTPLWYPAKTDGGMMRQDRIVLPIPPGVHWKDEMPILLPTAGVPEARAKLEGPKAPPRQRRGMPDPTKGPILMARGQFAPPGRKPPEPVALPKPEKVKREKVKADPAHVAKARELRDRYLEQFNAGMVLPNAKYDVARMIEAKPAARLLEAA